MQAQDMKLSQARIFGFLRPKVPKNPEFYGIYHVI